MSAYTKIAVIHPGAPGDLVLAAPVIGALKKAFPGAELDAYSRFPIWLLFDNLVDSWFDLESSGIHKLFAQTDPSVIGPVDLAVTWMGSGDETFISNLAHSTEARVIAASTSPPPGVHATDYIASHLGELFDTPVSAKLVFKSSAEATQRLKNFLAGAGISPDEEYLAVHPGSGSYTKCWPANYFAELINRWKSSNRPAVLIEGPADEDAVRGVSAITGDVPVLKRPDWELVAALLHGCRAYAGNDSGIAHLAAALGAPVVAVFGPTDPTVWGPRGKEVTIIQGKADCAPCSAEERNNCQELTCLGGVTVGRVWEALAQKSRLEVKND